MFGSRAGKDEMSGREISVSPYLLRPCRGLEEVLRDLTERAACGSGTGSGIGPPADPASEPAHDALEVRRQA